MRPRLLPGSHRWHGKVIKGIWSLRRWWNEELSREGFAAHLISQAQRTLAPHLADPCHPAMHLGTTPFQSLQQARGRGTDGRSYARYKYRLPALWALNRNSYALENMMICRRDIPASKKCRTEVNATLRKLEMTAKFYNVAVDLCS